MSARPIKPDHLKAAGTLQKTSFMKKFMPYLVIMGLAFVTVYIYNYIKTNNTGGLGSSLQ